MSVPLYGVPPKNDTTFACYNSDEHRMILIICGSNVDKKGNQMVLYIPPFIRSGIDLMHQTKAMKGV